MTILALDLGKFKTVACVYRDGDARFETIETLRSAFSRLIQREAADVVGYRVSLHGRSDLCVPRRSEPFPQWA